MYQLLVIVMDLVITLFLGHNLNQTSPTAPHKKQQSMNSNSDNVALIATDKTPPTYHRVSIGFQVV